MTAATVWIFFYGSFMNLDILRQTGFVPERHEVAKLHGFDIDIRPLATLVRSDQHCVYGIVAAGTQEQLHRLYGQDWVAAYLPEPVLVETLDGKWRAAFCYIAPVGESRPATSVYIDRIVEPAKRCGFPSWYIARLESFRSR